MTNDEARMTKEARNPNDETQLVIFFELGHSSFFRHSDFVIRHFLSLRPQRLCGEPLTFRTRFVTLAPVVDIKRAVITAAGESLRTLPLQTLVDRDGVTKTALAIILEEVLSP